MNSRSNECGIEEGRRVADVAYAWRVTLSENEDDPQTIIGHRMWLAENPIHREVWERINHRWERSHNLRTEVVKRLLHRTLPTGSTRTRFGKLPIVLVAAACGLILIGFGFLQLRLAKQTTYLTQLAEQRTVILDDGTSITLDAATELTVRYDGHTRRVALKSGAAFFDVAHDETRPFSVSAGDRKVIALGTTFTVRHDLRSEQTLSITLIAGRVAVAKSQEPDTLSPDATSGKTILQAGQRLQIRSNGPAVIDYPSLDEETGWMRRQIYFKHARLIDAVAELNRYNSAILLVVAPSISQWPIGGIFRAGDSESFARGVVDQYDVKVVRNGHTLTLEPASHDH